MTAPIAVVGAGPAGSVAATLLARAGHFVDLIDLARFPRDKACGDVIGPSSIDALTELGLADALTAGWRVDGRRLFGRDDDVLSHTSPDALTANAPLVVPRTIFDAALRDGAIASGAVPVQARLVRLDRSADGGRTTTLSLPDGRTIERSYSFVIGADGARSQVAHLTGRFPGLDRDHAMSIRRYVSFTVSLPRELWFFEPTTAVDDSTGPCYAWAFPVDDRRCNIGVYSCAPTSGRSMKALLDAVEHRVLRNLPEGSSIVESGKTLGGIVRYDFDPVRSTTDRVALVGDAVGLADAVIGEGIAYAVKSAACVAETLIAHEGDVRVEDAIIERYRDEFETFAKASRAAVARGDTVFDNFSPHRFERSADAERSARVRRIVREATVLTASRQDAVPPRHGSCSLSSPGRRSTPIPAGCEARFEVIGGGGAGGHWGGSEGGRAEVLTGVIAARPDAYELVLVCAGGGQVDESGSAVVPALGGDGGTGHVEGGRGGWGAGNGAGGGGGGGGASALFTLDRSVLVIAGGGGGGGGGIGEEGADVSSDDLTVSAVGDTRRGGSGGNGVTRAGRRGGGGGGGGGGSPSGDGGGGGIGACGGARGANGMSQGRGVHATDPEATVPRARSAGLGGASGSFDTAGEPHTRSGFGRAGHDGAVYVEWFPAEGQGSTKAGTATSTPG